VNIIIVRLKICGISDCLFLTSFESEDESNPQFFQEKWKNKHGKWSGFSFFLFNDLFDKNTLILFTNTKHILHTLCYVKILLRRFILREREATEKLLVVVHQKEEKKSKVCPASSCLLLAYGKSLTSCIEYYL
jgi:hypothetical protein